MFCYVVLTYVIYACVFIMIRDIILLKMGASGCYERRDRAKKGNGGNRKQTHLADRIEHLKPAGSLVKENTVTGWSVWGMSAQVWMS